MCLHRGKPVFNFSSINSGVEHYLLISCGHIISMNLPVAQNAMKQVTSLLQQLLA